ncbi:MAG: hypothetical protein ABJF56_10215, partial [Maribacter dokdonensis]|uniref:beta strand repeat-containing protein n=2 Tax=Maribacter dokdonensis TaxID=320912 RepID=UPI00328B83C9
MKSRTTTTLGNTIKFTMVLFALLLSGISMAQTTVTLEDQCNCEVLQGTDVTAPGGVTPAGADLGDLYVNTDTGTIYFWDGDSWEYTSTDANTTNASLTEDGVNLILTDSDLNTVSIPLADIAAIVDTNTTNVTFTVNSTNGTLDIIDSDSNVVAVPLADIAALVNTDEQEGTEVLLTNPLDVDGDSVDETTVEEAIADIAAANALDLDIDPTNELTTSGAGAPIGTPANNNPGVTYLDTDTNELYVYDGTNWTMVTDNQNAGEVEVTPAGNITTTNVQSALEELDGIITSSELTTTVVEGDGVDVTSTVVGNNTEYTVASEISTAAGNNLSIETDGLFAADDQNAGEVEVTPAGNITTTNVQSALEELDGIITSSELTTTVVEGTGIDVTSSVTGNNTEYTVTVDPTDIVGDGSITSSDIDVTGGANSTLNDVTLTIADNAITNAKMADDAITTTEILDGTIVSEDIAADAVNAATINADVAGAGLAQNATTGALEVDEAAIADGTISSTNSTIDITGGDDSVFKDVTLDVADDAITTEKIAAGAVESSDIAADAVNAATINADVAGAGLAQNATTGALEVDEAAIADGTISSTNSTIDITGGDDSVFKDVTLDVADDAITTEKIAAGAVESSDIAADAVNAATINADVAGAGLAQNATTGALEVDEAAIADGTISSTNSTIDITGGDDSVFKDVTLDVADDAITTDKLAAGAVESSDIAADAVNAATINADVAGAGLAQNATTGALEVDEAAIADGTISSTNSTIDITGGDDSVFKDVTLDVADDAITTDKIAAGAVETSDISDDAVALEKLANGTANGQVMQWNGTDWILIDLGSVTVTENDGVIGNEVVGPSNGTLTLSGAGSTVDPLRLAVSTDGITTNEIAPGAVETADLADEAVTLGKLADGNNTGEMIQWNGTDWEYIDPSTLIPATTVSNTSTGNTLSTTVNGVTGAGVPIVNSNVLGLDTNNDLISTVNGEASSALDLTPAIQANQTTTTVVEGTGIDITSSVTGNNTEYTVTVDPTDIIGDGSITSSDLDVVGGANATLNDVSLTIADDAVDAATINADVAGAGLAQNATTGALEVDEAAIADGTISSTNST